MLCAWLSAIALSLSLDIQDCYFVSYKAYMKGAVICYNKTQQKRRLKNDNRPSLYAEQKRVQETWDWGTPASQVETGAKLRYAQGHPQKNAKSIDLVKNLPYMHP